MKKFLSLALLIVLVLSLALTSCGKKQVQAIEITEGFKYEYEIGETPDFSAVKATIVYNDGTTKEVDASELTFGKLDTSTAGKKDVEISYGTFTTTYEVTVKGKAVAGTKSVESIEYLSGLPTSIYVGDRLNFDAITILVNYDDGSEETKAVSSTSAIKHNGAEISTESVGAQTLTITYMGKSVDVAINVQEIVIVRLDVVGANLNIVDGTEFDPTGMKVEAIYNNGSKIFVPVADLTITQDGDTVTIEYGSVSTTLTLNVESPSITSLTLNTTNFASVILVGDSINTASVVVTGNYNNGLSETLDHSAVTFSAVDTDVAGNYTITVTYNADTTVTASFDVTVVGIASIKIDASTVDTLFPAGIELNTSNVRVRIVATDGSTYFKGIDDGVTVDASGVEYTEIGTYYITASYEGVTSEKLAIVVQDPYLSTDIYDVDLPDSISDLEEKKQQFVKQNYAYVVGDDNPFIFRLKLTILDDAGELVDGYSRYTSYSEVYYNGALLSGSDLANYVTINENDNSFDFTEAAIGKNFTIKTRPANGIIAGQEEAMTREITVEVVDALNIYNAWELNYITNYNDSDAPGMENRTQYVDSFLATKGATRPTSLAGIVLHNDLIVNRADVPKEYFVDGNRDNDFYDYITVFAHGTDSANPTFTFHGNYFTIFSYNLPNVCEKGIGNQTDHVSSGQLFRFTCNDASASFDHNDYQTNIQNLYLRDNNPNNNNEATANRDMRGLIAMKVQWQIVNVENIRVEAYYISFYVDTDRSVANVNNSILFNAYQNHVYAYNANQLQGAEEAPSATHQPVTINITNSKITKCGGPVILTQTEHPEYNRSANTGPQVTIDDATEIWTWVTGTEAWFKATGTTAIAQQIQMLGLGLAQMGQDTIVRTYGETNETAGGNVYFMNMIMVNIINGTDVNEILNSAYDLDGKLTIGDKTYLNMNDEAATMGYGYGDATVTQAFLEGQGKNTIVNTCSGGTIVFDANYTPTVPVPNGLGEGDYVATYFGTFGFVFGYAPFE